MQRQFATFRLGDDLFGIDVLLVDEINKQLDLVPVSGGPAFVRGLLNLRGRIVTVIDLGVKLGAGQSNITGQSRCVVLKTSAMISQFQESGMVDDDTSPDLVGLLVGKVEDMVTVEESQIDPPPANVGDIDGKFLAGIVQMDGVILHLLRVREVAAEE